MKVFEIDNLLADEHKIVLIDNSTLNEVFSGDISNSEYRDCQVLGIGVLNSESLGVYINGPKVFSTYLDVEYSFKVKAVVPEGEDPNEYLARIGKKILEGLPNKIYSDCGGNTVALEYGFDNMESGSFYDNICEDK